MIHLKTDWVDPKPETWAGSEKERAKWRKKQRDWYWRNPERARALYRRYYAKRKAA